MPFDAVIELSSLDGTTGFQISGEVAIDQSGVSVASAGDINGDGYDDLIIGAWRADPNGASSGASYVVFGKAGGFAANINLSSLDGITGFQISGEVTADYSGSSVASAGDINGDGYDDLIIGAWRADPNGSQSGASYVVFGKAGGFAANLDLSALDGTNGFQINGESPGDYSGYSVASAGDVNGDGYDDLIIGAQGFDADSSNEVYANGASYVVFGKAGGFTANLNLSTLDGTGGFRIIGAETYDYSGFSVASAGDVNGDGFDDLIIGAWGAAQNGASSGAGFVVFGKAGGFITSLNISALDGTTGFKINGEAAGDYSGWSVASAGDVNGDGYDDVIMGALYADPNGSASGASYVVFGKASGFAANLILSSLDGTNGFQINGEAANDSSGVSVASAGDVNGDGYDDLIIGAFEAAGNGYESGASYVVFGKAGGFTASLNLSTLDGTNGFKINGEASFDESGVTVASAGDVNGDGYGDLIIGAPRADPNGSDSGASYVIFGRAPAAAPVIWTGTPGPDSHSGALLDDQLSGLGGNDTLNGEAGDDELNGNDGADKLFGGAGADDLVGGFGNDRLDGGGDADALFGNEGNDYLDGAAGADLMTGGLANDVYIVDNAGDQTIELSGEGFDIVRTAVDGWVLAANIEGLELQGIADIDGSGNSGANNLQGNAGANSLDGGAGVDTINGADGNDTIIGGLGNDLLRGGTGADVFAVSHIASGVLETDQIRDFSDAEGDILDLSGAFAGTIELVGAFSKTAGQMTLTFAGGVTTLRLDTTGDGKVDYQIKINGDVTGDSAGWML